MQQKKQRKKFQLIEAGSGEVDLSDPQRRCIATGQIREKDALLRFAVSPDGLLVHDIGFILPGRGIWVSCDAKAVELAVNKRLFAKAAKRAVTVPEDLVTTVDQSLARQILALLGLGRKGGLVTAGFAKVEKALKSGKAALLIAAYDGAEDGRQKLRRIAGPLPVIDIFSVAELSQALGKENVVHACLASGMMTKKILTAVSRLKKYRGQSKLNTEVSE
ncbi:RNA-binding protein [Sneathiella litorea]|uniref:RNA-binding protein n=1 Tax=Sneathiella litorea TaxID=2606216 RepID=A0A6L8W3D8_9PROT|nr:RNA-binding protein [Sneathiella litorea]MZR29596.1 RNA-binding protein [Sneathiella litorea]